MNKSYPHLLAIVSLIAATMWANTVMAQDRTWGASGLEGEIIAVDCMTCGDDIGIAIACQGQGNPAAVRVPFAAIDISAGPKSPIVFDLDGEQFTFEAESELQSMVGFVPLFSLPPNHPMFAALQSAGSARISFAGLNTKVGLRGSRSALTIFAAHCGWAGLPPYTEKVAQTDGPQWFTSEFVDDVAGTSGVSLAYGIPETDNALVTAACVGGAGARTVEMNLLVDFGGAADGDEVDAIIEVDGLEFSYSGSVFEDSSEFAGVRIEIGRRAPLWNALSASSSVRVGVARGGLMSATSTGADTAIAAFTDACFNTKAADAPLVKLGVTPPPGEGAVAAPLVQLDFGAVDTSPTAPLVKLNLGGGGEVTTEKAPLIKLETTAPAGTPAPLIKLKLGSTAEPVIAAPAPAGTRYLCDDGLSLNVVIETAGSVGVAKLAMATGEALSLAQIPSSFGKKYSDGKVTLRVSPGTIQIAEGSSRQFCTQQ